MQSCPTDMKCSLQESLFSTAAHRDMKYFRRSRISQESLGGESISKVAAEFSFSINIILRRVYSAAEAWCPTF